ncbi:MAG: hypothetical protein H6Q75_242 [Firmicutes bacterium]|nr:hypothetical protein [Bacillota bacterium]
MTQVDKNQEPVIKPLHQGISVADMEASIAWYQKMFGFKLVSDKFIPQLPARIAFMELGDFSIELFVVEGAATLPEDRRTPNLDIRTHGTKHVAYRVQDLRSLMEDLKSKNVDIAMDVFPMEGDLVSFIRDNTGNLIELIQKPV